MIEPYKTVFVVCVLVAWQAMMFLSYSARGGISRFAARLWLVFLTVVLLTMTWAFLHIPNR